MYELFSGSGPMTRREGLEEAHRSDDTWVLWWGVSNSIPMKDREDHPFWLEIYTEERIPAATFCLGSDGLLYEGKAALPPAERRPAGGAGAVGGAMGTGTQKWRRRVNRLLRLLIVLSNLWIAYGFIQTVLERRPGDVHRLVRVVIEFQQVREQKGLCYSIYSLTAPAMTTTGYFGVCTALGRETEDRRWTPFWP